MYASDLTERCATKKGPRRDVLGELACAIRRAGLEFGTSSNRVEHWFYFDNSMYLDSDVRDTSYDIRFTTKGNTRYAIVVMWPSKGKILIKSLAYGSVLIRRAVKRVELLSYKGKLACEHTRNGLIVQLPPSPP